MSRIHEQVSTFIGNHKQRLRVLSVCVLLILVAGSLLSFEKIWLFNSDIVAYSRNLPNVDRVDVPVLIDSLDRKPTFASTFSWWHESWVPAIPFWRPLTIQSFWLEKRFFTLDRYDRWMWLSFFVDLACILAFGMFVRAFTGRLDIALLAVLLYGVLRPGFMNLIDSAAAPAMLALDYWKNQPDLWADLLTFTAMYLTVMWKYWPALACCFLSVCFKEGGWFSFLLCAAVLAYRRDYRHVTPALVGAGLCAVLLLVGLRWSAGHAVMAGYQMGTNINWFSRYSNVIDGFVLRNAMIYPASGALGAGLFVLGLYSRRMDLVQLLIGSAAVLATVVCAEAFRLHSGLDIAIASLLDPQTSGRILVLGLYSAVWLAVAYNLIRARTLHRPALFAFGCALITSLSYVAAAQVQVHVLHLATAFQSWLIALAIVATWEALRSYAAQAGERLYPKRDAAAQAA